MRNKCNLSKPMQNLIVLNEPNNVGHDVSSQYGNMWLNRFCIDEDAAFETSGVYNLERLKLVYVSDHYRNIVHFGGVIGKIISLKNSKYFIEKKGKIHA